MGLEVYPEMFLATFISALSFPITFLLTKGLISYLPKRGLVAEDFHKQGKPKIPVLGGSAIMAGILVSEALLYSLTGDLRILSISLVTLAAGVIGLFDDLRPLRGIAKPILLALAATPILVLGTYDFNLSFPLFNSARLSIIYPIMIILAIPITANTVNTIDVFNGVVSSLVVMASVPMILALLLQSNFVIALGAIPLLASSLAFYVFHRYPSRIFPGDSGTLTLGALYGAIAIVGGVEIVGMVALLPAILNSFFYLSSVKKFLEHRNIKTKPIIVHSDSKLSASKDPAAPMTLARMILAEGKLTEKQVGSIILKLAIFSAILAGLTSLVT